MRQHLREKIEAALTQSLAVELNDRPLICHQFLPSGELSVLFGGESTLLQPAYCRLLCQQYPFECGGPSIFWMPARLPQLLVSDVRHVRSRDG
jgi:hypothetical protein